MLVWGLVSAAWGQATVCVPGCTHADLQSAIDDPANFATITVMGGVHEGPVVVERDLTLIGTNGARLVAPFLAVDPTLEIGASAAVTVVGLQVAGGGLTRAVELLGAGPVTLDGVRLTGGNTLGEGGCLFSSGSGDLTLVGGEVSDCTASSGGGLAVVSPASPSSVVITGTLLADSGAGHGSAVFLDEVDEVVLDGVWVTLSIGDPAVAIEDAEQVTVVGSRLSDNFGGALWVDGAVSVVLDDTWVTGNASTLSGRSGGVEVVRVDQFTFLRGALCNNHGVAGGALRFEGGCGSGCLVEHTVLDGNTANLGGAVRVDGAEIELRRTTLLDNDATLIGRAVSLVDGGRAHLDHALFFESTPSGLVTLAGPDADYTYFRVGLGVSDSGLSAVVGPPAMYSVPPVFFAGQLPPRCSRSAILDPDHPNNVDYAAWPGIDGIGAFTTEGCGPECADVDGDGSPAMWDCDDGEPTAFPGASEVIGDAIDQDCSGDLLCFRDDDGDGFGRTGTVVVAPIGSGCVGVGIASDNGDCRDLDPTVFPGAPETVGDGLDQDCDGADLCYLDQDGDGFTGADLGPGDCDLPGFADAFQGDCDDQDPTVSPNVVEIAGDGRDGDCDGVELCFEDADGDGHGSEELARAPALDCAVPGLAPSGDDCAPLDASIHPGAPEIPGDGVDQDCDSFEVCFVDQDGDGATGSFTEPIRDFSCTSPGYGPVNDKDCDDTDPKVFPGAPDEAPGDGVDQDCDEQELCFPDGDGDGFGREPPLLTEDLTCGGDGLAAVAGDCDDADPAAFPGAPEVVGDGVDQDCDGADAETDPGPGPIDTGEPGPTDPPDPAEPWAVGVAGGGGCGCASPGGPANAWMAAILLLALRRRA